MKEAQFTVSKEVGRTLAPGLGVQLSQRQRNRGFSLAEVVISVGIITLVFAGIIQGNVQSTKRAEWSGYALAAQNLANQQIEQARSALWDTSVGTNQLFSLNLLGTNISAGVFRGYSTNVLDLPISGTNAVMVTNFVWIRPITLATNVSVYMVQVDTVWPFHRFKGLCYFTNSAATYVAQDDRSPGTF
jgi:type II secretory pathway pseudopilin PulG